MDLRRLADAFRAHQLVTALGLGAAILLAFLAFVRVSPGGDPTFQYRRANVWGSTITIQLTQEGFPEGRVQDVGQRRAALIALTPLYARLATTDPVRQRMRRFGPVLGGARVDPVVDDNASSLPVIKISSFALTKAAAVTRAQRQASAFMNYVASQQSANHVAPANRVVLKTLSGPTKPEVIVPRKKTLPVVVFLAMLIITTGVVLVLENFRRARETREAGEPPRRMTDSLDDTPRKAPVPVDPKPDGRPTPVAAPPVTARTVAMPPARRTLGAERSTELRTTASDGAREDGGTDELAEAKRRSRASRGRSR
jgi:hypothetical protein